MSRPSFSGDRVFYALNLLAAGSILLGVSMLVWRVTAWIGLVLVALSLAALMPRRPFSSINRLASPLVISCQRM